MENKSSFLKDAIESITTLANKAKEPKTPKPWNTTATST